MFKYLAKEYISKFLAHVTENYPGISPPTMSFREQNARLGFIFMQVRKNKTERKLRKKNWGRNQVGDGTKLATKSVGIGDSNDVASLFTELFEYRPTRSTL